MFEDAVSNTGQEEGPGTTIRSAKVFCPPGRGQMQGNGEERDGAPTVSGRRGNFNRRGRNSCANQLVGPRNGKFKIKGINKEKITKKSREKGPAMDNISSRRKN